MKHTLRFSLFLSVIFSSNFVRAQVYEWTAAEPSITYSKVATDAFSNSFVLTAINDTTIIGNDTLYTAGGVDMVVVKYDGAGSPQWATSIGGVNGDYGQDICYDNVGGVWITGSYSGGSTQAGPYSFGTYGGSDALFVKLDATTGAVQWAQNLGGTGTDQALSINADASGNIFANGVCQYTIQIGSTTATGNGGFDAFVLKLDNSGNPLWLKKIWGSATETSWSGCTDVNGNYYIAGAALWSGSAYSCNFCGTTQLISAGTQTFVCKLNSAGVVQWISLATCTGEMNGIAADVSGNCYVTGNFDTQSTFGGSVLTGIGMDDNFVAHVNNTGTWDWAANYGTAGNDGGWDAAVDAAGNGLLVLGGGGTYSIGSLVLHSGGAVVKFSPTGTPLSVLQPTLLSGSTENLSGVAFQNGAFYASGYINGTVNFGDTTLTGANGYITHVIDNASQTQGTVYRDWNNDAMLNGIDTGIPNVILQQSNGMYCNSGSNGVYHAYALPGNDTITIPTVPIYHTLSTPPFVTATFSALGQIDTTGNDFGLYPTPGINDLRVTLVSYTVPKQGYVQGLHLTWQNIGTTTLSGCTLSFSGDAALNFVSAYPSPASVVGNNVSWNLGTLAPSAWGDATVLLGIPTSLPVGTPLNNSAAINPFAGDFTAADNAASSTVLVVSSFDPNFKEVEPAGDITPTVAATNPWMTYTIHFQNTGTAAATTVLLRDTLNPNLNISSLEILASITPVQFNISGPGYVDFLFENINLPDSGTSQAGSCGFITYRLRTRNGLVLGDSFANRAGIYFDYNPVVLTNNVVTHVANPGGIVSPIENVELILFPNPATSSFVIRHTSFGHPEECELEIRDILGRVILTQYARPNTQYDIRNLSVGIYFVQLKTKEGIASGKLVKE